MIEMMVAIGFVAILVSVGLPKMSIFLQGNRMVANVNDLLAGLHIARSEAIKRNTRVSICKSENSDAAVPSCATTAIGWEKGWFVFVEGKDAGNVYGEYTPADGAILRVNTGAEGSKVTITGDAAVADYVTFTSRGIPKLRNGAGQSGIYRVCDDRGLKNGAGGVVARGVVLNPSGRVRVTNDETKIVVCP